jgi:UDPglucose 6-dehydrogenase
MVKYLINCFFATKVSFANEMAQICEALELKGLNVDYDKVVEYASYDKRLGPTHWKVPGPDGDRGFGGHCFPKDINALMYLAKSLNVDPKVLNGAWEKNQEIRKDRNWERQIGRAVSFKKNK